jgi:hypothetical protein
LREKWLFGGQPIPDPGLREEVSRSGRLALELAAERAHVDAEIVGLVGVGGAPHLL